MKGNILIVEDDVDISKILSSILEGEGYAIRCAYSGTEGEMCIEGSDYDLILLDLMLPGISGEELIEKVRKAKIMPIIVVSSKSNQEEKINVLKLGADDFVCKPFDVYEVLARVEVQLRRYKQFSSMKNIDTLKYKKLSLNKESRQVFLGESEVNLTYREFSILELLMENPNKVFTRANIFESIWKEDYIEDEGTVNVHISHLRSKLSKLDKEVEYIKTVWGIGFKLNE